MKKEKEPVRLVDEKIFDYYPIVGDEFSRGYL